MLIDHRRLRDLAIQIFIAGGSEPAEAEIVADHLVEANLRGHDSHGVGIIPSYVKHRAAGSVLPNRRGRLVKEEGAIIVYDGERGYGQVVAGEAIALGIAKAEQSGLAAVALRNAYHIGRVGAYGEQCAAAGLVSLHFVNVTGHEPHVAPHRGRDARLGTNPICIALPEAEPGRPAILDMATSKVALGKLRVAKNEGRRLSPDCVLDAKGEPSDDPQVLFDDPIGALLPFGEHKGYAFSLICDLLAGAIAGGGTLRPENQVQDTITNAMLAFILDPGRIGSLEWIRHEVATMTAYVTASPPRKAGEPVLIPGDPERQSRARRVAEGVPIDPVTWADIVDAGKSLGLALPTDGRLT
jgi:uncharacterized oxidoreductase